MRLFLLALMLVACGSDPPPLQPLDATADRSTLDDAQDVHASDVDAVAVPEDIVLDAATEDVRGDSSDAVAVTETGVDASAGVTIAVWTAATDARPRDVLIRGGSMEDCRAADTTRRYPVTFSVTFPSVSVRGVLALNSADHMIVAQDLDGGMITTMPSRIQFRATPYVAGGVRRTDITVTVQNDRIHTAPVDIVITGCILIP